MAIERTTRERTAWIGPPGPVKVADVEYRAVFNKAKQEWNVFRNGSATDMSARKKKKSATDSAIRAAKAELAKSDTVIIVTCVEGRKIEAVWKGP
jgi:hypothetical protein